MVKIGVTGTFCSGKDSFAEHLMKKGFEHISLSKIIREEADKRGIERTRENLLNLGNELREKEGKDVLADRAISRMKDDTDYVITSIRNPLEVKHLASSKNFVLVNIDAPIEKRFERLVSREDVRKEDGENLTFEKFKASEEKEMESDIESSSRIKNCIAMARLTITNDSDLENFYKKIEEALPKLKEIASFMRPGWDEYFMEMAQVVGKRGTCDRGRSGSVIVKDKRVMCSGYVGSPPKLAHCDDVGHWFKKTIHKDGSITQHCLRTVHSEANAVAQAAKNGVNIDGSTLYTNMEPCVDCAKLLISAGIKRVICKKRYHGAKESREMFEEAGVKLEVLNDEFEEYVSHQDKEEAYDSK